MEETQYTRSNAPRTKMHTSRDAKEYNHHDTDPLSGTSIVSSIRERIVVGTGVIGIVVDASHSELRRSGVFCGGNHQWALLLCYRGHEEAPERAR